MKTSLICLLLLVAVACAAPKAEEMRGGKRAGISEKMGAKMAEKRKEIAEKMHERAAENDKEVDVEKRKEMAEKMREMAMDKHKEMAEEKREESEELVAGAKSDGKAEARSHCSFYDDFCIGYYGEYGCYYDYCYNVIDELFYDYSINCWCCNDQVSPQCYLRTYYPYY